jgi:hypothetical protein
MAGARAMSEKPAAPGKIEGPLSSVVEGVKLPVAKAGQIVNEIADQAPLSGRSGAILAVGLVTGRRALARTGAQMLTSQIIAALARSVSERLLPDDKDAVKKAADDKPASPELAAADQAPPPEKPANAAKVATGALAGAAALAAGGWLLSRLLTRKPADKAKRKVRGRTP